MPNENKNDKNRPRLIVSLKTNWTKTFRFTFVPCWVLYCRFAQSTFKFCQWRSDSGDGGDREWLFNFIHSVFSPLVFRTIARTCHNRAQHTHTQRSGWMRRSLIFISAFKCVEDLPTRIECANKEKYKLFITQHTQCVEHNTSIESASRKNNDEMFVSHTSQCAASVVRERIEHFAVNHGPRSSSFARSTLVCTESDPSMPWGRCVTQTANLLISENVFCSQMARRRCIAHNKIHCTHTQRDLRPIQW